MKDNKNIIELFKHRKYNEFLIEKRTKIQELQDKDPLGKFVDKTNEAYRKLLKDNGMLDVADDEVLVFADFAYTANTQKAIAEVEKDFKDKMDDRDRVIAEVMAQVAIVETYEQEIAIYKKYGVLTEDGKLYDYKK